MVGRPARRPDRTTAENSGRRRRRACAGNTSGGELLATLAPTAGEDRPARAGPHPQPEAVGLRPTAVVRLERALAHEVLPLHDIDGAHPPVDGRARGGRDGRRRAAPRRPRKLVTAVRSPHRSHLRDLLRERDGGRNRPQTPASITEERTAPGTGRIPTAHGPPDDARDDGGTPEATRPGTAPSVAGLWTGLLASPSLRVGRQGHDAWADPVGQPTAVSPVPPPETASDLQRCGSGVRPVRSPAGLLAGRAQPVDTGVEPVCPRIHNGC